MAAVINRSTVERAMRRALASSCGRFSFRFVKKEIELVHGGVGIQLFVPAPLFVRVKRLDDAPVFFRGEVIDTRLDLLDSAHAWSLSPCRIGVSCLSAEMP